MIWIVLKKEIRSFLSSLIGYVVMGVFLVLSGLFIWVLKGNNIWEQGVASLQTLFNIAPYLFVFLVSAITMRSFSEEKRLGTFETLTTKPIKDTSIILGKYLAAVLLVAIALLPTLIYYYSIYQLGDPTGNIDKGNVWGSYLGLLFLAMAFASIGIFSSVLTDNQIVALLISMTLCFTFYEVFSMIGEVKALNKVGKGIEWFGLGYHYNSISRGVLDTRDVIYFFSFSAVFISLTRLLFSSRKF